MMDWWNDGMMWKQRPAIVGRKPPFDFRPETCDLGLAVGINGNEGRQPQISDFKSAIFNLQSTIYNSPNPEP